MTPTDIDLKGLPRLDPYTSPQLTAAVLVIAVPAVLAFTLGSLLASPATGAWWAAVAALIAGSVVATSMLVSHVGVFTAVLGVSGVWGLCAGLAVWAVPSCPELLGGGPGTCGPREYAAAVATGMAFPWLATAIGLPIGLAARRVWTKYFAE